MAEQDLPESYPIAYLLVIIIILPLLVFTGGPSHKSETRKVSWKKDEPKKTKIQSRKKTKKPVKKTEKKDSISEVFKIDEKVSKKSKLSDREYFQKVEADYQKDVYSKLKRPADRTDMVIRYYKKDKDKDKVSVLKSLGLYVHERPSDIQYADLGSNAIFYGDSIKKSDIQIIAYTLFKAGLDLKVISPSIYHDTWKAHSLEIGSDTTAINAPNLKLSDIRKQWSDY